MNGYKLKRNIYQTSYLYSSHVPPYCSTDIRHCSKTHYKRDTATRGNKLRADMEKWREAVFYRLNIVLQGVR